MSHEMDFYAAFDEYHRTYFWHAITRWRLKRRMEQAITGWLNDNVRKWQQ